MKSEIRLSDLSPFLGFTHLKLNLDFLNELLKDASNSDSPHRKREFANTLCCPINSRKNSSTTIYGWMKGYKTIPLLKLSIIIKLSKNYSWADIENNLVSIKAGIRNGEIRPRFPIKIDGKFGSIVGHILGDGSIDKRFHSLFFSNSNVELLKEFSNDMKFIFGIEPRIWIQKRKKFNEKSEWLKRVGTLEDIPESHPVGLFYPKICSDILYILFGKFAEGKDKTITNEIKFSNREFKKFLIRSFFDDEGSIQEDNYTARFHQDRKEILNDFKNLLREFNINSNPLRSYIKRGKLRYYFNLTGFKEYFTFYNTIGCTSSKKKSEFEKLINKVRINQQKKK